jgi:TonB family protein
MRRCGSLWVLLCLAVIGVYAQSPGERDADGVYSTGPGVTSPKIIQAVPAEIPSDDSLRATRHVCVIETVIAADGSPGAFRLISAPSKFDDAAVDAIRRTTFQPGVHRKNPVPVRITVYVPVGGKSTAPALWGDLIAAKRATIPRLKYRITPELPEEAVGRGISGAPVISLMVTEGGDPVNVHVASQAGYGLDEVAVQTVRGYRYRPATIDGIPTVFSTTVTMSFRVQNMRGPLTTVPPY